MGIDDLEFHPAGACRNNNLAIFKHYQTRYLIFAGNFALQNGLPEAIQKLYKQLLSF
jgi:hypothetical protein